MNCLYISTKPPHTCIHHWEVPNLLFHFFSFVAKTSFDQHVKPRAVWFAHKNVRMLPWPNIKVEWVSSDKGLTDIWLGVLIVLWSGYEGRNLNPRQPEIQGNHHISHDNARDFHDHEKNHIHKLCSTVFHTFSLQIQSIIHGKTGIGEDNDIETRIWSIHHLLGST